MQSNTIKLLSCLTSWEELLIDLKSLSSTSVIWFHPEVSFNVNNSIET